jgi:hypothetical protein
MKLIKDIYNFLIGEQSEPRLASRPKSIANAIKKRHPVSFFYNGPRGKVQPGRRVKAEMVALGLSKKGKMIVRAWVQPPSRSKTGFEKNNWRTFILSRMSQIEIFDQETFDQKRPGYKEGDDNSMSVTYVTSDWSPTPEPQVEPTPQSEPQSEPQVEPQSEPQTDTQTEPQPEPQVEPQSEPQPDELPKPEPENTPSIEPPKVDDDEDEEDNDYDGLNESIKRIKRLLYN